MKEKKRIDILEKTIRWVFIGFIVSVTACIALKFFNKEIGIELLILNVILGSALTTIIGVLAGTSLD